MNTKRIIIIAAIVILLIIIVRNWSKITGAFSSKKTGIDQNAVYTASLNEMNSVINEYQQAINQLSQDVMDGDPNAAGQADDLQKKIAVMQLQQKTGVEFSNKLIDDLLKKSLADLTSMLAMTNQELLQLFEITYG